MTTSPPSRQIHERYIEYLKSPAFTPTLGKLAGRPWSHTILAGLYAAGTVTAPLAVYHGYKMLTHAGRKRKDMIMTAELAEPITTYPLMVNTVLTRTPGAIAPGLVIGSFRPRAKQTDEYWLDLTMRLSFLAPEDVEAPEEKEAARWLKDESYMESKRLRLPRSLTDGCDVHAFHLRIVGDFLPDRLVSGKIPCVAVPGAVGAIQPIPWWIAEGKEPPARR